MKSESDIVQEQATHEIVRRALEVYGSHVIEDRAIPDVRDGLKPAQRRLLWALYTLKRTSKSIPVKSATVVGETIGKYHPHGELTAYTTLVHLAWLRYGLAERGGNFGNLGALHKNASRPAAPRYTTTRMMALADHLFDDIAVMPLQKSFSEEHEEPIVLPTRIPLLLANGSQGLAMAMRTTIPPHNLGELLDAAALVLRNPEATEEEVLRCIKGPDYGRGTLLSSKKELRDLYHTGKGKLEYCCDYHLEEGHKRGLQRLVITGFAPNFNPERFENATVALQQQKLLARAAYDDGSKEQPTRVVVEFSDPAVVRDRLLPLLQTSIAYQFYALDKKRPVLWTFIGLLKRWLRFRVSVDKAVLKREQAELARQLGAHQARLAALLHVEDLVELLKTARSEEALRAAVQELLKVEEWQAEIILRMPISALRRSSRKTLDKQISGIEDALHVLRDKLKHIRRTVAERLEEMRSFVDARGTKLRPSKHNEKLERSDVLYWVGAAPNGLDRSDKLPLRKGAWKWVGLVPAQETIAVVTERNVAYSVPLMAMDRLPSLTGVVGIASEKHHVIVVLTHKGYYSAFAPQQKRNSFTALKLEKGDSILCAVGMQETDRLCVRRETGRCTWIDCANLRVTRPGGKPKLLRGKGKVTHAWTVGSEESLYYGKRDVSQAQKISDPEKVFCLGAVNLVVLASGQRKVVSQDEALQLKKQHAVPLRT